MGLCIYLFKCIPPSLKLPFQFETPSPQDSLELLSNSMLSGRGPEIHYLLGSRCVSLTPENACPLTDHNLKEF